MSERNNIYNVYIYRHLYVYIHDSIYTSDVQRYITSKMQLVSGLMVAAAFSSAFNATMSLWQRRRSSRSTINMHATVQMRRRRYAILNMRAIALCAPAALIRLRAHSVQTRRLIWR